MKTMTCNQLGGACDIEFYAKTFDEIAKLSKQHALEMFQNGDIPHLKAMNKMSELMKNQEEMKAWFDVKKQEFNSLPDK